MQRQSRAASVGTTGTNASVPENSAASPQTPVRAASARQETAVHMLAPQIEIDPASGGQVQTRLPPWTPSAPSAPNGWAATLAYTQPPPERVWAGAGAEALQPGCPDLRAVVGGGLGVAQIGPAGDPYEGPSRLSRELLDHGHLP